MFSSEKRFEIGCWFLFILALVLFGTWRSILSYSFGFLILVLGGLALYLGGLVLYALYKGFKAIWYERPEAERVRLTRWFRRWSTPVGSFIVFWFFLTIIALLFLGLPLLLIRFVFHWPPDIWYTGLWQIVIIYLPLFITILVFLLSPPKA